MISLNECRACRYFKNIIFGDPVKGEYVICMYEYDDRLTALLNERGRIMINCPRNEPPE